MSRPIIFTVVILGACVFVSLLFSVNLICAVLLPESVPGYVFGHCFFYSLLVWVVSGNGRGCACMGWLMGMHGDRMNRHGAWRWIGERKIDRDMGKDMHSRREIHN